MECEQQQLTALLRRSQDPLWQRVRRLLTDKGLVVETTAVAVSFEDGTFIELGVVATRDQHVYQYTLRHDGTSWDDAEITSWKNLTGRWKKSPFAKQTKRALTLARGDAPASRPADRTQQCELLLELPYPGGQVVMRWPNQPTDRRVSFWYDGKRLAIDRRVTRHRNGKTTHEESMGAAEVPGDELIDLLPPPPIQLSPAPRGSGLARLDTAAGPAAHQTAHWVLHVGERASGTIYNSPVSFNHGIRVELDLDAMIARYVEVDRFDDE